MKKYNYFDDEPEMEEHNGGNSIQNMVKNIDFHSIAHNAKNAFDSVISGEAVDKIKQLPDAKKTLLKLLAFILFIAAVLCSVLIFSHTINSQNEKNDKFCKDAGKVCTDYIVDLGTMKWENLDSKEYGENMARLTGLCYARQMDFNNDNSDELMLCYNDQNVYYLEVWGYHKKKFVKFYSEQANKTNNEKDGSWVGFYHKNNKYYICKSEPDTPNEVNLYELRGNKFKKTSSCEYDYKDDIYYIDKKINASDFETIRLSVLRASKAEVISEIVTNNIDAFSTVSLAVLESKKSTDQLKAEAYYSIIEKRLEKYGKGRVVTKNSQTYIDGVGIVALIDFNGDGNEELFLTYRKIVRESQTNSYSGEFYLVEEPVYCMEVYSWNGSVAKKIFSKNGISTLFEDTDANYIMFKKGEKATQICNNAYSYSTQYNYTATSRIYRMKGEKFDSIYNARMENNYGYRQYYIDNEYVYQSHFSQKGFEVPMFLNDEDTYDASKYQVTYLSGKNQSEYQNTVDESVKVIQQLNSSYSPD